MGKATGTITVSLEDYALDMVTAYIQGLETAKQVLNAMPCDKEKMLDEFRVRLLSKAQDLKCE